MSQADAGNNTKTLGEVLLDTKLISREQLELAQSIQRKEGKDLTKVLVDHSMISPDQLAMALSIQMNMPLIDLKRHVVQPEALRMIPEETARKHTLIPLDIVGDSLIVVMADPTDIRTIEDLQAQSKMGVEPSLGVPSDIEEAIGINYRASGEIVKQMSRFAPLEPAAGALPEIKIPDDLTLTPVTQTLDLLIQQAVKDRASDIHIEPQESKLRIRYRIDGILRDVTSLPLSAHPVLVTRLKILSGMNIAEQRRPQDGQFSTSVGRREIDIRVATVKTIYGEKVTMRILDKALSLITLDKLGFLSDSLETYRKMISSSYGMILVGGPTGSGKTTTLYASINQLDRTGRNIMTVEDPVEYHFADINQIQVNVKAGITFATGLRALMRHDPDIILVGEIRDGETANMAAQASLTGHLVFSSIHANDSVGMLFRMMDLGVEAYLVASTLVGVISQRMIRRICLHCKTAFTPSQEEIEVYRSEMGSGEVEFYHGDGCNFCNNTGYLGRIGVFETLVLTDEIRRMLISGAGAGDIRNQTLAEGLVTMRHDGMMKVREGITTVSEVLRGVSFIGQ